MSTKWSLVGVVGLGLVAALCMTGIVILLPGYLHGAPVIKKPSAQEVQIMVAAKTLPAMSIVDAAAVKSKTVPKSAAPEKYAADGAQVVGKVLVIPMVEGQPFTSTCFVSEGSGAHLASALSNGMRAFGILLNEDAALTGLLYPGSIVDVLVAQKAAGDKSDSVARLLLQAIQVLSVEDRSIVSGEEGADSVSKMDRNRKRLVTLMVDGEQAKLLHAATQCGTVTLAMRNPLDTAKAAAPVTAAPRIKGTPVQATAAPWELTILRAGQAEMRKFAVVAPN